MVAPTYIPPIGRLAADRYDFQNHKDGAALRHNADAIDVIPSLVFDGYTATNVYSSLDAISQELIDLELSGKGFILVGDGYDTYHNSLSDPDNPYDAGIPAFDAYLDDVLNNPDNPLYFRIRDGGIVVIKAGTYKFTSFVNVPAGIILMGEGYGSKIVNQGNGTDPMFVIKPDVSRIPDAGVDGTGKFIYCRETMLWNLTIADNFLIPTFLGDLSYKDPINNVSGSPVVNPLVLVEEGASLTCQNMRFVGKTTYTLGTLSDVSSFAVAIDSTVPSASGTRLKIVDSSIDGFAIPVNFTTSGTYNSNIDITGSLIRGYGFYTQDFVDPENNTIIQINTCNANIVNNYCVGNDTNVTSMVFVTPPVSPPVVQGRGKIIVANNNAAVDRTDNTVNSTFEFVDVDGALNDGFSLLIYGNNFGNRGFTVSADGDLPQLQQTSSSFGLDIDGTINIASSGDILIETAADIDIAAYTGEVRITSPFVTVSRNGGPGTFAISQMTVLMPIQSVSSDLVIGDGYYMILVDASGGARNITLPPISLVGRILIIKDTGSAGTNNITLIPDGSDAIEGLSANYVMEASYQVVTLISNTGNWSII